jgi:uncharacterized protein with WD repeat
MRVENMNWGFCAALCLFAATEGHCTPRPSVAVGFHRNVAPILKALCVACHGDREPSGGLSLTSYASLMRGGKGGREVAPGHSGDSRLVKFLTGALQPQMPIGGKLKPEEIGAIRAWIDAGAKEDAAVAAPRAAAMPMLAVPAPVSAMAFSPDGKILAVGAYKQVQLRDAESGRLIACWSGHPDAVRGLAYTRDGKWLIAGGGLSGASGEVRIWNVSAGREARVFGDQSDTVTCVAVSPDGSRIASGSVDRSISLWDFATGKSVASMRDHAAAVSGLAFSPDGKYLASCGVDRSVKLWDAKSGRRLYSIEAHGDAVNEVEFSPDGRSLLTAGGDDIGRVWDFKPDESSLHRGLEGHNGPVLSAAFSSDGKSAATAGADHEVRIWDTADWHSLRRLDGAKDWVYDVRFRPNGDSLAAGTWDGSILIWNAKDGKLLARFTTGN